MEMDEQTIKEMHEMLYREMKRLQDQQHTLAFLLKDTCSILETFYPVEEDERAHLRYKLTECYTTLTALDY